MKEWIAQAKQATISVSHSVIVNAMSAIPLLSVEMKSVKVVKKMHLILKMLSANQNNVYFSLDLR